MKHSCDNKFIVPTYNGNKKSEERKQDYLQSVLEVTFVLRVQNWLTK